MNGGDLGGRPDELLEKTTDKTLNLRFSETFAVQETGAAI